MLKNNCQQYYEDVQNSEQIKYTVKVQAIQPYLTTRSHNNNAKSSGELKMSMQQLSFES